MSVKYISRQGMASVCLMFQNLKIKRCRNTKIQSQKSSHCNGETHFPSRRGQCLPDVSKLVQNPSGKTRAQLIREQAKSEIQSKTSKCPTEKLLDDIFLWWLKGCIYKLEQKCDIGGGSQNSNAIKGTAGSQVVGKWEISFSARRFLTKFSSNKMFK